jgi:hypothetical protein
MWHALHTFLNHIYSFLDWGTVLTSLKFLGLIVSGVAGYAAALPEPKHKKAQKLAPRSWLGRLTRKLLSKEWTLRWVVIGLAVALLSQFVETIKTADEAKKAEEKETEDKQKTDKLLTQLKKQSRETHQIVTNLQSQTFQITTVQTLTTQQLQRAEVTLDALNRILTRLQRLQISAVYEMHPTRELTNLVDQICNTVQPELANPPGLPKDPPGVSPPPGFGQGHARLVGWFHSQTLPGASMYFSDTNLVYVWIMPKLINFQVWTNNIPGFSQFASAFSDLASPEIRVNVYFKTTPTNGLPDIDLVAKINQEEPCLFIQPNSKSCLIKWVLNCPPESWSLRQSSPCLSDLTESKAFVFNNVSFQMWPLDPVSVEFNFDEHIFHLGAATSNWSSKWVDNLLVGDEFQPTPLSTYRNTVMLHGEWHEINRTNSIHHW